MREIKHVTYPVIKNASGRYERSKTPDIYIVRIHDRNKETNYLEFSLNGQTVKEKIIDDDCTFIYRYMNGYIKAAEGAQGLFRWFSYQFEGNGPFRSKAEHLIEYCVAVK